MPVTLDHRVYSSMSRSAGHTLHILVQRLRRANLPLLVAFMSALFMFLRALSGAGYVDSQASPAYAPTLNYTHLTTDKGIAIGPAYVGFAEHWARFKEAVLSCPPESNEQSSGVVTGIGNGMESDAEVEVVDSELAKSPPEPAPTPARRVGVGCLKERLSGAIGLRNSNRGPNAPTVKQEDRAFKISLDGIPSRRKGDATRPERRLR